MKYLVEDAQKLVAEVQEELHESSGLKVKNYFIHGIFSTPDKKNRNGRIYPSKLWEKQVQEYQRHIKDVTVNAFGENEHPARTNVDKMKAVMRITELKMEDGVVKGRAKILNNNSPETNQIKALIDEGMKIGVSSRGVGTVKNGIVEEFKLSCYDLVQDPSDYNADLEGITESLNESMKDKSFQISENGNIEEIKMCTKTSCSTFSKEAIQEATKEKFEKILSTLTKLYENDNIQGKIQINISGKIYDHDDIGVSYTLNIKEIEKSINEQITKMVEKKLKKKLKNEVDSKNISITDGWEF